MNHGHENRAKSCWKMSGRLLFWVSATWLQLIMRNCEHRLNVAVLSWRLCWQHKPNMIITISLCSEQVWLVQVNFKNSIPGVNLWLYCNGSFIVQLWQSSANGHRCPEEIQQILGKSILWVIHNEASDKKALGSENMWVSFIFCTDSGKFWLGTWFTLFNSIIV